MATPDTQLIGYWPLTDDHEDHSPVGHRTQAVDVELGVVGGENQAVQAARFNGQTSLLQVPDHSAFRFGTGDLTVAAWVRSDDLDGDVVGDLVSKFDPHARRGLQLSVVSNTGVTSTAQANHRHLHFGIDNGIVDAEWTDCGRPGEAVLVAALTVHDGNLFAGTVELGPGQTGRLWRYDGGQTWVDLGNPDGCNAIDSAAGYDGALYCGTGRYMAAGSALGETLNTTPGGKVYRVEPDGKWTYCGHPGAEDAVPEEIPTEGYDTGKADDAISLTVYRGRLFCTSNHRKGAFVYEGGTDWRHIGPDGRLLTFTVYRGRLYALMNGGPIYRYEGEEEWTWCGCPETSTQTYGAVVHEGRLYVGTWPRGEVYRYEGGEAWTNLGRVAYECEVMGMVLYNGKVYLGGLPMANVYRMDSERFTFVGNLDASPTVLRRVWSLAVCGGKLFAGTLPSGRVRSLEAGKLATWDHAFPYGWHHVAAVKERDRLSLYVDGQHVTSCGPFSPADFDLTNSQPLRLGFGCHDHFRGWMREVRLYSRALDATEVGRLAQP